MQLGPRNHPGTYGGGVVALVATGITVLTTFGVDLTVEQVHALLAFAAVAGPLLTGLWSDHKTTPLASPHTEDGVPLVPEPEATADDANGR